MKVIFRTKIAGYNIRLYQSGDRYEVHYGADISVNLDYAQAASKLGEAIMHAQQLEDDIVVRV